MRRIARRLTFGLLALTALLIASLTALAALPQLEGQRRAVAERLLERLMDRPVEISGPVDLSIASLVTVTMSDLAIGQSGTVTTERPLHMQEVSLSIPVVKLARGNYELEALSITGLKYELPTAGKKTDAGGMMRKTADVIISALKSKSAQQVSLHDVSIVRRDDPDGWNGEIEFREIVPVQNHADGSLSVEADGTFNGSPLAISISIAPMVDGPDGSGKRPFDLAVSIAGAATTLKGNLGIDGEEMDAALVVNLTSVDDLLTVLRLRSDADGKGQVSMRLSGQFDALKADSIEATVELESGEQATINGQIADATAASGIDLTFDVSLKSKGGTGVSVDDTFDLELETLRGHISGNSRNLAVDDLNLSTNIASVQFGEIGPVTIERITRDDDGRISIVGLSVKNGDPDDPDLDLSGEVKDVLALSGISLAGSFKLYMADLLSKAAASKAAGNLRGQLAISDASGSLRVDEFSAKTVGDGPLQITLELQPAPRDGSNAPLNVTLEAPSLDEVAAAVGAAPIGSGGASFKGAIRLGEGIRLSGDAGVGKTSIEVNLRTNVEKGRPVLRGGVKSPRLRLSDMRRAARLASLFAWQTDGVTLDPGFAGGFEAEIDIAAAAIDGPEASTGALATHLSYKNRTTALAPLRLDFLGGRIEAQLTLTPREKAPSVTLKGTVAKMDLGALLTELEVNPVVTGALDAGVDLTATGDTLGALAASLNGGVTASINDGKVGTRLIDLAGQDVVSWVFSGSKDGNTRLVCANIRMAYKQGLGEVKKLIIETENVQLVGGGSIDLRGNRINLSFQPRPIRREILETATPFDIQGSLSSPEVSLKPGAAGTRAVAETVALPLHLLTSLLGGGGGSTTDRVPCTIDDSGSGD